MIAGGIAAGVFGSLLGLDKREAAEGTFAGTPAAAAAPAGGPRGGFDDTEIDELPF